ncbi:MAG: hypothetical protein PUH43_05295 [Clostridium sp.]|nr:hypothetical protein [Clostridium sp.]
MLLKALDLLRTLGWGIIHFIYSLIDSLFDILRGLNAFDIINSVSGDNNFITFQKSIIAIAVTLLGLFAITRFAKKIIDPDESMSSEGIVKEIIKCGILIIMSTFLFVQASTFSIKLAGFTSNIFSSGGTTLSASMETMFIDYSDGYKDSDEFKGEDIAKNIKNGNFDGKKMYNDKYVTSSRWILPDEKDYKYSINWIMAIIVGGFFLYSLFFCGMMLARRQIEFLFLFVISPIVFATSIGNKERRNAVVQQLVSLMLQGAVIMLIISLTAIVMGQINETTFFSNAFKDIVIKSIMYIGCGSFLLTGSQVVNRFIGGNVSANSGREQLMAMMGFGQAMGGIATTGGLAAAGAGLMGAGAIVKGTSKVGGVGNSALGKVGQAVSNFGSKIGGDGSSYGGIGSNLKMVGDYMQASSNLRRNNVDSKGQAHSQSRLSRFGSGMMNVGSNAMASAMQSIAPTRTMYRRRYRGRDE